MEVCNSQDCVGICIQVYRSVQKIQKKINWDYYILIYADHVYRMKIEITGNENQRNDCVAMCSMTIIVILGEITK